MYLGSPIATLAQALHHAAFIALPDTQHMSRDTMAEAKHFKEHATHCDPIWVGTPVRPRADDQCKVAAMFPQTWSNTALGFGGVGGQAISDAYTIVIEGPEGDQAVYFNAAPAYLIRPSVQTKEQRTAWFKDLQQNQVASQMEAAARYGAKRLKD